MDTFFDPQTLTGVAVAESLIGAAPLTCVEKLDRLASLRNGIQDLLTAKQAFIDGIVSQYHHRIDRFDEDIKQLQDLASPLEFDVKSEVLAIGTTVKGSGLQAVYSAGRESVDVKMFRGYAMAHPEVQSFLKIGDPSVSFRAVKSV